MTITTWPARLLSGTGIADFAGHVEKWGPLPTMSGAAVIAAVDASGLLGRGGAGFPTGRKMRAVAANGGPAVVIANGAEGEPASAKDKLLLTHAPHLVLDGIELAARAVNANEAYLVVHAGTSIAAKMRAAVAQRPAGVRIEVRELPPRYVASEETAIVHWLNGGDALPTFGPSRPFERGVHRQPTLVNNVETLGHLATIARRGPDWFRALGDPAEPGTLLVTVSGAGVDRRVGEFPTGTTIGAVAATADIDIAESAAVLVGGYFGTWIPASRAERLPMTHQALREVGGGLGAAVVAVLPPDRCGIVETARVARYLAANSAGQCGPCLNGLPAIAGALTELATGQLSAARWPALERWLSIVPGRGACRHPDGAVRIVASGLSTFAADVDLHRSGRVCAHASSRGWLPTPATPPMGRS